MKWNVMYHGWTTNINYMHEGTIINMVNIPIRSRLQTKNIPGYLKGIDEFV